MIDDDQRAESREWRRIRYGAFMHRGGVRPFRGGHLYAISDDGGAESAGGNLAKLRHHAPIRGPRQIALERTNRQGGTACGRAGVEIREGCL